MGDLVILFEGSAGEISESLQDFCVRGLSMPASLLRGYSMVPNLDAFYVHTTNHLSFMVSGPEVSDWEFRRGIKKVCSPEREEIDEG